MGPEEEEAGKVLTEAARLEVEDKEEVRKNSKLWCLRGAWELSSILNCDVAGTTFNFKDQHQEPLKILVNVLNNILILLLGGS